MQDAAKRQIASIEFTHRANIRFSPCRSDLLNRFTSKLARPTGTSSAWLGKMSPQSAHGVYVDVTRTFVDVTVMNCRRDGSFVDVTAMNCRLWPLCATAVYHHRSRQQDDLDEDAVNAWSTCEPGEPEAAAVAGSEDTRLSDGCLLLEEQRQHQQQRRRTIWVKPWLLRRVTLGHYDTFMQDLMCGARPVPEQEPHGCRTVYVGAPCGLFTSAVRYDPGISHGRRTASGDMWPRRLRSPWDRTMSEKTTIARRGHYLTVSVAFVTEPLYGTAICINPVYFQNVHCKGFFSRKFPIRKFWSSLTLSNKKWVNSNNIITNAH